jgi:hypothetical protein
MNTGFHGRRATSATAVQADLLAEVRLALTDIAGAAREGLMAVMRAVFDA